jgi:hypothetical protein
MLIHLALSAVHEKGFGGMVGNQQILVQLEVATHGETVG